ncbi:STAS domain-containing protein [Streptomyces sp. NPDC088747]|uniref:STAS domain-containing protein n=1 Tax=Streptomyces sp. NPDC088747 TaxID=3365886 RepID=UPI0037FB74B4
MNTQQADQPWRLAVSTETVGDTFVVTVAGEIDHQTGGPLRQALNLPDDVPPRVVVDLRQVPFIDSSGINLFITAHHTLAGADGWLRLAGAVPPVLRTIKLVGIDQLVECHPTVEQALGR